MANAIDEFPPESADDVLGLLHLGSLTDSFEWGGHNFVMRTLRTGEELAVTLVVKEYEDSVGFPKAIAAATVAAALESVDGRPLVMPLMPGAQVNIADKFNVVREYYWPVLESLYNRYLKLYERMLAAFDALQSKS